MLKKIFFALQFSILLFPFAPLADIAYYSKREGGIGEGVKSMLYDAMLGCSYTGIPRMLIIFFASLSVIGIIGNYILKKKNDESA